MGSTPTPGTNAHRTFIVYVLQSLTDGGIYIGMTPTSIAAFESTPADLSEAPDRDALSVREREKALKSGSGREMLKRRFNL